MQPLIHIVGEADGRHQQAAYFELRNPASLLCLASFLFQFEGDYKDMQRDMHACTIVNQFRRDTLLRWRCDVPWSQEDPPGRRVDSKQRLINWLNGFGIESTRR